MQDSPGMYKLFLQLAKISVLVTHLPSINPSGAKPYRSRPRGGRSEVRNCLGWEGRTFPPPWHLTRCWVCPVLSPRSAVLREEQCCAGTVFVLPHGCCRTLQEQQDRAWLGAAPPASGLITCSSDFCKRMEAFFSKVARSETNYGVLGSLYGAWFI